MEEDFRDVGEPYLDQNHFMKKMGGALLDDDMSSISKQKNTRENLAEVDYGASNDDSKLSRLGLAKDNLIWPADKVRFKT
jgi:hypothetical protein